MLLLRLRLNIILLGELRTLSVHNIDMWEYDLSLGLRY